MDQSATYGQMDFSLPHDVVQLPTGGIFYKSKKKSVKVGYLTASDENILIGAANSSGKDGIVISLLRNKIYEPDLRPEELLNSDVEAILIFLRNTSFGPEYNVSLTDPQTGKKFDATIVLDELNIKKCKAQPDEDGTLQTKLPRSGNTVKLKPISMGESLELEKMANDYPSGRIAPTVTWRLMKQIVSIDGNEDKGMIAKFIESMPIMDSKHIRTFINENEPGLDLTREVTAPSGEKVMVNIAFGVEFFRPFF
jgi:hypothetical protein